MPFPVDERFIVETEKKLGVRFPVSFRLKMMEENGGDVITDPDEWQLHPFFDTSDKTRIKRTCNDIVRETASARVWTGFPQTAVAIGSNGSGDQLILLPSQGTTALQEAVFWWDHETGTVHKIAEDFTKLNIGRTSA